MAITTQSEGLLEIGKLILAFSRVNRVTYHDDGVTPESDSDHTVMLSVAACALASKLYPTLDIGLIAQFAIVHDIVEAYALDTDAFMITDEGRKIKEEKEHQAFLRIQAQFKEIYPWLPDMIEKYEKLDTKEARFVKTVDKLMPKITFVLDGGASFKIRNIDEATMWSDYERRTKLVAEGYGKEFPEVLQLTHELMEEAKRITYARDT